VTERILDLKLLPSPHHDEGVYLLTDETLYVLGYDAQVDELTLLGAAPKPAGMVLMINMEVHQTVLGDWRAYVMGPLVPNGQPKTRGLVVCDLGTPLGSPANHDLQFLVGPDGAVWNPALDDIGQVAYTSSCFHLALRNEGGTTKAYVACGFDRQITVLDVMDAGEIAGQWTHELDALDPPQTVLERIVLDPAAGPVNQVQGIAWSHDETYLHAVDANKLWTVDPSSASSPPQKLTGQQFGYTGFYLESTAYGPSPSTVAQVWSLTRGAAEFVQKRIN
jgi:hypothetical protein